MNVKYRDLLNSVDVISDMMRMSPAPIAKVAAKLARNVRLMQRELETFSEVRNKLLAPLADESGKVTLQEGSEVSLEYEQLLDSTVDVDIRPLTLAELDECERARNGFSIPVASMYTAWFMFEGTGD